MRRWRPLRNHAFSRGSASPSPFLFPSPFVRERAPLYAAAVRRESSHPEKQKFLWSGREIWERARRDNAAPAGGFHRRRKRRRDTESCFYRRWRPPRHGDRDRKSVV